MTEYNPAGQPDIFYEIEETWKKVKGVLLQSEYSFTASIEPIIGPNEFKIYVNGEVPDEIIRGHEPVVNMLYNNCDDTNIFEKELYKYAASFEQSYIKLIDNDNYSVTERISFFVRTLRELKLMKQTAFEEFSNGRLIHKFSTSMGEVYVGDIENDEETILMIEITKASFVKCQFSCIKSIEDILELATKFIPKEIKYINVKDSSSKLNFDLSRAELVIMLKSFQDSGIILNPTTYSIAKFAEQNFLYNSKEMKNIESLISDFRQRYKASDASFSSLKTKLSNLFLKFTD